MLLQKPGYKSDFANYQNFQTNGGKGMKSDVMLGLMVTAFILAIGFGLKTVAKKTFSVNL